MNASTDTEDQAPAQRPPHWVAVALIAPIVAMIAMNNIGAVRLARTVNKGVCQVGSPLGILALNSTNKVLAILSFQVSYLPLIGVSSLRLFAPDPLFYLLGYLYSERAIAFGAKAIGGSDELYHALNDGESAATHPAMAALVFLMPNNPVCLIAGVLRMPLKPFLALNIAGTVGRIVLFKMLSDHYQGGICDLIEKLAPYQRWLTPLAIITAIIGFAVVARRMMAGAEELTD